MENGITFISKAAGIVPKCFDLLSKLSAAIQTKQQFEEHGTPTPDSPVLDCEEEQDMEL